jgi:hypothetical protein
MYSHVEQSISSRSVFGLPTQLGAKVDHLANVVLDVCGANDQNVETVLGI